MEPNYSEAQASKDRLKIIFSSILGTLLILVELYLMINNPLGFVSIALFGVLILGDLYFLINTLVEVSNKREEYRREQYDGIYKTEKASYILFRKYFDSLAETLTAMDEKLEMPAEEIIEAQKAVAKVTINRSKENTDALMNSNDKLIEKLFQFEDLLAENNERLLEKTQEANSQNSKESDLRQAELASKMREMELSIKNEIYQSINQMALASASVVQVQQPVAPAMTSVPEPPVFVAPETDVIEEPELPVMEDLPTMDMMDEPEVEDVVEEPVIEDIAVEEPAIEDIAVEEPEVEDIAVEEPVIEDIAVEEPEVEDVAVEEPAIEEPAADLPPMPDLSDPNKQMSADDIAALFANMAPGGDVPASEPEVEDVAEEPVIEDVAVEEPAIEEPAAEIPPMPDLSDPNKQMSADDIAALFANMAPGGDIPASEPEEVAEEPVIEDIAVEEPVAAEPVADLPPMPDLSDPNRTMTADEIEALFANM